MAVTDSLLSLVYGSVTLGGSTARQILAYYVDEHDYVNGACEVEFITTAATDAALKTEIDTLRDEFRKPRQDLTITQGSTELLHRKQSDNTGLDCQPHIIKDGDPADTGRSRHFRVRITYELPADNLSQNFRRIAITGISFSPSRRRTVTIEGEYTANSTDGTTAADTQYFAQIAAAATTLLSVVDSTKTWEKVSEPDVRYSETRKTLHFIQQYKELLFKQSSAALDDGTLIDPHMEVTVEQMAPGDSLYLAINPDNSGGGTQIEVESGTFDTVVEVGSPSSDGTVTSPALKRPSIITVTYESHVDFTVSGGGLGNTSKNLLALWTGTIRGWIIERATVYKPDGAAIVLIDEQPAYEDYENHVRASATFMAYVGPMLKAKITYADSLQSGLVFDPVTLKSPFAYFKYQGPAVHQVTVTEEYEEKADGESSALGYAQSRQAGPGAKASIGGGKTWYLVTREPQAYKLTSGLAGGQSITVGYMKIQSVYMGIIEYKPSTASAGKVPGGNLPVAT